MEFHGEGPALEPFHFFLAIYELVVNAFAILLNLVLCCLLILRPKTLIEKPRNFYLLNLAVWDTAFSILCAVRGFLRITRSKVYHTYLECKLQGLFTAWLGMNSIAGLTLVAMDRYLIVVHNRKITLVFQVVSLLIMSIINSVAASSSIFFGDESIVLQPSGYYCLLDLSSTRDRYVNVLIFPTIVYSLNLISILYFNAGILQAVYKAFHPLQQMQREGVYPRPPSSSIPSTSMITTSSENAPCTKKTKTLHPVFIFLDMCKQSIQKKPTPIINENTFETTSSIGSKISGKATLRMKKRARSYEIQQALKTVLMGSCHIILYLPFGICGYLQMAQVQSLSTLDTVGLCCIELCLILDPLLVLLFDREMVQRKKAAWENIKKAFQK